MNTDETRGGLPVMTYEARGAVGWQAAGFIAGGAIFLLMLVVQFLLLLAAPRQPSGNDSAPGILGGISVIGIGLIARGVYLLRSVTRVRLDPTGIHLERLISRQSIGWDQIERIDRGKRSQFLGQTSNILNLVGRDGKVIAFIPDTINRFDSLAEEISYYSASAGGRTEYDAEASQKRLRASEAKKAKRAAVLAVVMTIVCGAIFVVGVYEEIHLRRYDTESVVTNAKITHRYMVRVTPRLQYFFRDDKGATHSHEVMMDQDGWDALEGATTVPVQYLRSDPEWNRLVTGQHEGSTLGGNFLFLSGGLTLFLLIMTVMLIAGFDLKTEKGQFLILRNGKLLKSFGQPTAAVDPIASFAAPGPMVSTPPDPPPDLMHLPPPPVTYPPPQPPPPTRKPPGMVALGILSIVFGIIGASLCILRMLMIRAQTLDLGGKSFVIDVSTEQELWWLADGALAVFLIVAGVGLVLTQRWGRSLGIVVALLQLLSSAAGIIVAVIAMRNVPTTAGQESTNAAAAGIGAVIGQLISAIFPTVLLLILIRRTTAEALEKA